MNIEIISICDNNNYGNRLQSYALQRFLQHHFGVCKTVWWQKEFLNRINTKAYSIKNCIKYLINWKGFRERRQNSFVYDAIREFNISRFTCGKIDLVDNCDLDNSFNKKCDHFVVGSDQVWNPNFWGDKQE